MADFLNRVWVDDIAVKSSFGETEKNIDYIRRIIAAPVSIVTTEITKPISSQIDFTSSKRKVKIVDNINDFIYANSLCWYIIGLGRFLTKFKSLFESNPMQYMITGLIVGFCSVNPNIGSNQSMLEREDRTKSLESSAKYGLALGLMCYSFDALSKYFTIAYANKLSISTNSMWKANMAMLSIFIGAYSCLHNSIDKKIYHVNHISGQRVPYNFF